MQFEEWKDIPDFEGIYQVSSLGRVKSLDRINTDGRRSKGRPIVPVVSSRGYPTIRLYHGGKRVYKQLSTTVAEIFLVRETSDHTMLQHKDGDRSNCNVSNMVYACPFKKSDEAEKDYDTHIALTDFEKYFYSLCKPIQTTPTKCVKCHKVSDWKYNRHRNRMCSKCRKENSRLGACAI